MIKKINASEYLKRYDNMSAAERSDYEKRVGEWRAAGVGLLMQKTTDPNASLQNVFQVSIMWNDEECQTFEQGVRLLSALVAVADTRLPDLLYAISAKRAIRRMCEALGDIQNTQNVQNVPNSEPPAPEAPRRGRPRKDAPQASVSTFRGNAGDGHIAGGSPDGKAQVITPPSTVSGQSSMVNGQCSMNKVPARPKHIDQYVHLLPQKTQERASQVQGLYRELDQLRERERLLMSADGVNPADREAVAKAIVSADNRLGSILRELDQEWAKLVEEGRVVVDDLGNARVIDHSPLTIDHEQSGAELTSEQKARRRELRRWLIDMRRGNDKTRDKHVEKWTAFFREFAALDPSAYNDAKVLEAAQHYGIQLDSLTIDH